MKQKNIAFWSVCGLVTLFPTIVLKGSYFPVLDDYIMYQGYPLYPISYLFQTVRVWTSRPVANVLDVFLWARFSENLFLLFLFFTALKFFAVALLNRFFEEQGWAKEPLCVLLLLCPVGVEATGWLSAASRMVVGLFFLSLSLWCLIHDSWGRFSLFLFLSFGCYEQLWLIGLVLSCFDIWKRKKSRIWIPFVLSGIMGIYTLYCQKWSTTPRMGQGLNGSVFLQIYEIWKVSLFRLIPQSIRRGFSYLNVWLIVALVFLFLLLLCVRNEEKNKKGNRTIGIVLFAVSYLPFLFSHQGLSFRMVYLSLIGLSLLLPPKRWVWIPLAFLFCLGSAGELKDYQNAGWQDAKVLQQIVEEERWEQTIYHDSSVSYGQHILSVTHSDWSLTAGLRAVTKKINVKEVTP